MTKTPYHIAQEEAAAEARATMIKVIRDAMPEGCEAVQSEHMDRAFTIMHGDERLGSVKLDRAGRGYSYGPRAPDTYVLTSPRIPSKSRWRDGGSRRYKNAGSFAKAVAEFCKPTTDKEAAVKRAEVKLDRYVQRSRRSSGEIWNHKHESNRNKALDMLGSMDVSEQKAGYALQQELVAARRKLNRYRARVEKYCIAPQRDIAYG